MHTHTALWGEMELAELAAYVQAQEPTALRATLLQQFYELKSYRNANEWNRLVRVCECLRIIGWAEAEPVEALAQVWLNGAWYTRLQNSAFACVAGGEEQEWRIRHGVQVLAAQPDGDGGGAKLASQRNPLPKSPLRWQCSGNHDRALLPLIASLERLKALLIAHSRPEAYGNDFAYVAWQWLFSHVDDENLPAEYYHAEADVPEAQRASHCPAYWIRPAYQVGRLTVAKYETRLSIRRHYTTAFARMDLVQQQAQMATDMLYGVDVVRKKLQAKGSAYDCDAWQHDLQMILNLWQQG